jgi:LPXTG-motif cell wall-anchored protein
LVTSNSAEESPKSGTLYTITFKVMEETEEETTTISFSESELHLNVEGTVDNASTTIGSVTINVKEDDTTAGNQGTEETPEDTGDETPSNGDNDDNAGDSSDSGNETNTKKNTTVKKNTTTKLPQTGAESASVIAIIALGAIAITSYISYRRYKNI